MARFLDTLRSLSSSLKCPNAICDEYMPGDPISYIPRPYHFGIQPRPQSQHCCKLNGLKNDDTIANVNDGSYSNSLNKIIIEDSKLDSIPKDLITDFRPKILHMIHCDLKTLKIADFTGATLLTEFNATHNQIEVLLPNIFIFAPNIETIDLSNNRITEVSQYSFENVPKLKILILNNNLIRTFDFKMNLISLQVFMIGNNSLTHLNEQFLERSTGLTEFCINDNKLNISELHITGDLNVFDTSNNPLPIYLNAKNFKIKNSNAKVLNISKKAVTIDASNNQINSIVVDPQNILIELNLSRNNYTTMQNLTALKSIQKLDLSFNRIEDFSLTSFAHMEQLRELNLENSGLKTIDFGLFSQQKYLSWLDISYNDLKEINLNMLTNSIERLFIEGNGLTNIDGIKDIEIILPHLLVLGLSNNRFSCEKLTEIRKLLVSTSVNMFVDEQSMVKYSRNINGIGCVNENSTETIDFSSSKLLPIHTNKSDQIIETIHQKIQEIETNVRRHSESLNENSINSKDDILSVKQELMNIRGDSDLKIIEAKADILMSISRLFNVSENGTDVSVDMKATVEEINKINLERYQSLSLQLKVVNDKLKDLVQSVSTLTGGEIYEEKNVFHLKQRRVNNDDDRGNNSTVGGSNADLISLKNMMTFITVAIICLIFGFSLILFYKKFYRVRRRYCSTNTVNTNIDQSLV